MSELFDQQETAVATREASPPAAAGITGGDLLELARDPNFDVEKLRVLKDMMLEAEDRSNRFTYFENWGKLQAALHALVIERTKPIADRQGKTLWKYAPLEQLVKVCGPVIHAHGFAWRFEGEAVDIKKGDTIIPGRRTWIAITGYRHEERTYVDMPIQTASTVTNDDQQVGSSDTYGERIVFKKAFAIVIEGEDRDAMSVTDALKYAEYINTMNAEKDYDSLRVMAKQYFDKLGQQGDDEGKTIIEKHFARLKREFGK